jgi:hypothetical protein
MSVCSDVNKFDLMKASAFSRTYARTGSLVVVESSFLDFHSLTYPEKAIPLKRMIFNAYYVV